MPNAQVQPRAIDNKVAASEASRHHPIDRSSAPTLVSHRRPIRNLINYGAKFLEDGALCQELVGGASAAAVRGQEPSLCCSERIQDALLPEPP